MTYFSKFPNIVITKNEVPYVIKDIVRRVVLTNRFEENSVVLDDYFVLDGETPEMVSNKLYGTPLNHWIVLLANNITDPREEWPIVNSAIIDRVYLSYDFVIGVPSGAAYSTNDELLSSNGGKFVVSSKNGNTIYVRSQIGFINLTTSQTFTNLTTDTSGLVISSVTKPENQVHHYYDTELKCIVDYDAGNINLETVTNLEYENEVNDTKRTIKVLNPKLITAFTKTFNRELNK